MYKVKEMPLQERPRERFITFGPQSLSNAELLAILIQSGRKDQSAIDLANSIILEIPSISELSLKTISELTEIKGIGSAKATMILAALELGKRVLNPPQSQLRIVSANDVFTLLKDEMSFLKQEVLVVLFLDIKHQLIAKKQVFQGSLNQSLIHPREVFKYAVKFSAFQIILVHNHPSGETEPSRQDLDVTKKFIEAGKMLGIEVIDHVIIGNRQFRSILNFT